MHGKEYFYGTTTLGEKGQLVIPAEAREKMGLKKGEKLLVFGMGESMLALSKLDNLEKLTAHLSKRLDVLKKILKKGVNKPVSNIK